MQQTYIIGRTGDQPFEIEPSRVYVHSQHARLTADTASREWFIENLKGNAGNGVYVRDANGDFRRVLSCRIKPTDVIRLGPENANSFTFMAHHVLTPDNYNYEFAYNRAIDEKLRKDEAAVNAELSKHKRNTILAPALLTLATAAIRVVVEMDMGVLIALCTMMTAIPTGIMRYIYRNDSDKLKAVKSLRPKLIQCPKCWRPLNDYDLRNCRCSACKAM